MRDKIKGDKIGGDKTVSSGDTYNVNNAAVVGRNVKLQDVNIKQEFSTNIPGDLAGQIAFLRDELKKWQRAEENAGRDTSDADEAIGIVAAAKKAVEAGDESKAVEYLKSAGSWLFDFATKIGVTLVTEVIKQQTGLR